MSLNDEERPQLHLEAALTDALLRSQPRFKCGLLRYADHSQPTSQCAPSITADSTTAMLSRVRLLTEVATGSEAPCT
jgi:hypothetical protein